MGRRDSNFGQFGETVQCRDAQHGNWVYCAIAPQLVAHYSLLLNESERLCCMRLLVDCTYLAVCADVVDGPLGAVAYSGFHGCCTRFGNI